MRHASTLGPQFSLAAPKHSSPGADSVKKRLPFNFVILSEARRQPNAAKDLLFRHPDRVLPAITLVLRTARRARRKFAHGPRSLNGTEHRPRRNEDTLETLSTYVGARRSVLRGCGR